MKSDLSPRRHLFVKEYLVDFNGARAAVAAGYAKKSANVTASKLLTIANIQEALGKEIEERSDRCKVDADHVLNRLIEIDQMDIIDVIDDNGAVKPISKWPKVWRQFLSGMDFSEFNHSEKEYGFLKKIKWPDKLRNLELIGRHLGMWTDKVHHKHSFIGPNGELPKFKINVYYVSPSGKVTKTITDKE